MIQPAFANVAIIFSDVFLSKSPPGLHLFDEGGGLIRLLQFSSAFDGFGQGHVVGVFDVHAHGNAVRNS